MGSEGAGLNEMVWICTRIQILIVLLLLKDRGYGGRHGEGQKVKIKQWTRVAFDHILTLSEL